VREIDRINSIALSPACNKHEQKNGESFLLPHAQVALRQQADIVRVEPLFSDEKDRYVSLPTSSTSSLYVLMIVERCFHFPNIYIQQLFNKHPSEPAHH
jgi:hypothetical protein